MSNDFPGRRYIDMSGGGMNTGVMIAIIFMIVAVFLIAILFQSVYGQIADLNTTVINATSKNLCLDFNGDAICEYIVLTNGTQVANPLSVSEVQNQTNQTKPEPYKLWERWLDGVRYTDIHEYYKALDGRSDDDSDDDDDDNDKGRYVGECKGQAAPDYPDYCSDPKDLPEDSGYDDDDLPQEEGCQEHDDYCDRDEGCHREDVDCIDDREYDEDDYDG